MNKFNLIIGIIAIIAIILSIVAITGKQAHLGGYTAGYWDSADGYKVDGTTVIDGDGNYDGAITGTTATLSGAVTLSSTLGVESGDTTLATATIGGTQILQGNVWSTSTGTFGTSTVEQVFNSSIWLVTPLEEASTLYLPATTSLYSYLTTNGDSYSFFVKNASGTAATANLTIGIPPNETDTGSGLDIQSDDSNGDIVGVASSIKVTLFRDSVSTTTVILEPITEAD